MQSINDAALLERIKSAAAELNRLFEMASNSGLEVDVDVRTFDRVGEEKLTMLRVKVKKNLL